MPHIVLYYVRHIKKEMYHENSELANICYNPNGVCISFEC